jgi:acetyl esterase/lipase
MIGILSLYLARLCTVADAVSPQSVNSDLSIITHNDLYGNATTRNAAAVVLDNRSEYSDATSRCAALETMLWNPDGYEQDLGFLQYLEHDKASDNVGAYWIKSIDTSHCRAITTDGEFKSYPCTTQLPALCSNTAADTVRQVTVATNNATIIGSRDRQAFRFLGLKYATIPARFAQSTYLPPTANTAALQYGPTCMQTGCKTCSEDCLYLNVWTPYLPNGKVAANKKKAVMLWIHGGGFTSGSGSDPTFDGSALASRGDVVVVTINYRLSVLGFLAVANTTATGNYGLQDANTALAWVLEHIEDFGGDKNRITIFGQSAGAASVRALLASPQAREKAAGAIMMSTPQGTGARAAYGTYLSIAEATEQAQGLQNATGCFATGEELVTCLKQIDPLKLVAQRRTVKSVSVLEHFTHPTNIYQYARRRRHFSDHLLPQSQPQRSKTPHPYPLRGNARRRLALHLLPYIHQPLRSPGFRELPHHHHPRLSRVSAPSRRQHLTSHLQPNKPHLHRRAIPLPRAKHCIRCFEERCI